MQETIRLVQAAQDGDRTAMDSLLGRYYPRVLQVVRLRMGERVRQGLDSGDILQETFLAAVRSFDRFEMRDEASLINWLSRIAQRRILNAAEKQGAQKRCNEGVVPLDGGRDEDAPAAAEYGPAADTLVPLDKAIRSEETSMVEECIAELDEHYRELILLRNYMGMSFTLIAQETRRPTEGAARMMHAKAMIELARHVRDRSKETTA